ncbi:MAG TPA: hypothetical protein VGC90_07695 [Candidatus Limnocylindrales bacterium]|jgi:hypothetical protein
MQQLWMCGECHSLNDAVAKRCYRCSTKRTAAEVVDSSGSPNAPGVSAVAPRDPSLVGALILGLIAAVAATALWYWMDGHLRVGVIIWGPTFVGTLIGVAVSLGGRGRTSFPSVLLSVLLTAICLVVGEYLLISRGIALAFGRETDQIVLASPKQVLDLVPGILANVPLRPVMWAFALIAAFVGPWYRLVGRTPKRGA